MAPFTHGEYVEPTVSDETPLTASGITLQKHNERSAISRAAGKRKAKQKLNACAEGRLWDHVSSVNLALALSLALVPASAQTALLESRAEGRLVLAERGEIRLFDFRPDSIRGWKVRAASLYVHLTSGPVPERLPVSTIMTPWSEDAPERAAKGMFRNPQARFANCRVEPLPQGWLRVELEPWMADALGARRSFGLAIEQGNRKLNGRGPAYLSPYIFVEAELR